MDNKANIQQNKLMQLENSMLMCGIYNADLRKIDQLCSQHTQPPHMKDCLQDSTVPIHLDYFMHIL